MKINKKALFVEMAKQQITKTELSKKSGVSVGTLYSLKGTVSPVTAGKIAEALNISIESIICE